jgi:hypothetical protein
MSFICPDRWLNNQYGKPLRLTIKDNYSYRGIVRLENINPFYENVNAYPIIVTIQNARNRSMYFYTANSMQSLNFSSIKRSAKKIDAINNDGELVLSDMNKNLFAIEDLGFKIGIGVASGADKIFLIDKEKNNIEDEVLVPLITRNDVNGKDIDWKNSYIINPFDAKTGDLIDLLQYPVLSNYLNSNKDKLMKRYIANKNPNNWYRTIDKIDLDLIARPKLLIPDISTKNVIYLDKGHYYPHHNFYYIIGNSLSDLLILRAFFSTNFVNKQIMEKCTIMNGGALRRQAQTLRKIKIPNIQSLPEELKNRIMDSYRSENIRLLESLIGSLVNKI